MQLVVRVGRRDFGGVTPAMGRLALRVTRLAWAAMGGPERAEIAATGEAAALSQAAGWLRCPVEIEAPDGEVVWWGYIESVELAGLPGMVGQVGFDLAGMVNRAAVVYRAATPAGSGREVVTAWAEDETSRAEYGAKSCRYTLAAPAERAAAEQARDTILGQAGLPTARVALDAPVAGARIVCRGWWATLGWEYGERPDGREAHAAGGGWFTFGDRAARPAVAQSAEPPAGVAAWQADAVAIRVSPAGTPDDALRVSLRAPDGAGLPGGTLASVDLSPAWHTGGWVGGDLSAAVMMRPGSPVWIRVERTGAANVVDNYRLGVDYGCGYSRGRALLLEEPAWGAAEPDFNLSFALVGRAGVGSQAQALLASGQFVTGVELPVGLAEWTSCPWRDGDRTILAEVTELLAAGDARGNRLLAEIGRDRVARVRAVSDGDGPAYWLGSDGRVYGPNREPVAPWAPVYGAWVGIAGARVLAEAGPVAKASPVFVERCELDVVTGKRKLLPRPPAALASDALSVVKPYLWE